jgi:hypothetical protein
VVANEALLASIVIFFAAIFADEITAPTEPAALETFNVSMPTAVIIAV